MFRNKWNIKSWYFLLPWSKFQVIKRQNVIWMSTNTHTPRWVNSKNVDCHFSKSSSFREHCKCHTSKERKAQKKREFNACVFWVFKFWMTMRMSVLTKSKSDTKTTIMRVFLILLSHSVVYSIHNIIVFLQIILKNYTFIVLFSYFWSHTHKQNSNNAFCFGFFRMKM